MASIAKTEKMRGLNLWKVFLQLFAPSLAGVHFTGNVLFPIGYDMIQSYPSYPSEKTTPVHESSIKNH